VASKGVVEGGTIKVYLKPEVLDKVKYPAKNQSLEMYRIVKQAELAVIPNADHFSIAQQFDVVALILQRFMTQITLKE